MGLSTSHTLFNEALYFWCATATTAIAHSRDPANPGKAPWLVGVTWFLFDVALPGTFMVFVMYWGLVYPYSTSAAAMSVMTHDVYFLVMVCRNNRTTCYTRFTSFSLPRCTCSSRSCTTKWRVVIVMEIGTSTHQWIGPRHTQLSFSQQSLCWWLFPP